MIRHICNAILEHYREAGIVGCISHFFKKICWEYNKRKFRSVGAYTYVAPPFVFHGENCISIGNHVTARQRLQLEAFTSHNGTNYSPEIIIGDNVSINYDVHIGAINKIVLEEGVLIASKVFITDHSHGQTDALSLQIPPQKRLLYSKGPVIIKKNAWIGEGTTILSGVTIGENSIVGANSVVTKDIPPNCIAAGVPAKIIKQYFNAE